MPNKDESFLPNYGLEYALELLRCVPTSTEPLPINLPQQGLGEIASLELLAGHTLGNAARLGSSTTFAHMDPPTPWITWAMAMWNASLNQNLLHESTSPFATQAEALTIQWLAPFFGMQGGHFCSGSSIANLTGLWAARDAAGIKSVVASQGAHLSITKACRLLGLELISVSTDQKGQLDIEALPDLHNKCLVLTAGTTATGAIDSLELANQARWTHVDAAWAGPLRLSDRYASLLDGVERANSVAMSGHKWFFQPKDSAIILFRDVETANSAIGLGSGYLAKPNVGVQGSRSAAAIVLLATLLAWGKEGIANRLEHLMNAAQQLAMAIASSDHLELWNKPVTAITVFRPTHCSVEDFLTRTPAGMLSSCVIEEQLWARSVAANPMVDINEVIDRIHAASGG